tara:strand:- start:4721 stop:4924 length:204 start_codon:yes stop_codon:yes gene_type:complete
MGPGQRTIKQVWKLIKDDFSNMESSLNVVEKEIGEGDSFNKTIVSFHFGKIYNYYKNLVELLEVFKD